MATITIKISSSNLLGVTPPPPGYKLFVAQPWPILELGLSSTVFGGSSFQVLPPWIEETKQFSAISNFSILTYASGDIIKLLALQPRDMSLGIKMGWLVAEGTGVSAMWTGTEQGWDTALEYRVGTMLWGGQLFAASEQLYYISTKLGYGAYRKVLPFRRTDWQKDPGQYPYLFPRASIVSKGDGISWDFGRGAIYTCLQVLDPADFKFAGGLKPSAFYVKENWCQPAANWDRRIWSAV